MNQNELNEKKERALAALPSEGTPDITKLKAMALFRVKAAQDVLELVVEVERLRAEIDRAENKALDYYVGREEPRAEVERLKAEVQQLKDECDQKNAEWLEACDQRNSAYAEVERLNQVINRMVY